MKTRVTQTDIARVAGVHNTTVSLALRHSRLIPEETRKRISAIAEEMGYCPDPALRALVAYRNSRRARRELGALAYATNWETKWGWRDTPAQVQFFSGAQRKAAELGYQLEHLWLGEPGMSQRRLNSVLLHRGISGLLLASHRPDSGDLSGIDWSRLSVVKIGTYPHAPATCRVSEDHTERVRLACREAFGAGYRRIGFVLSQEWDDGAAQAWSSACHGEQYRHPADDRLPLFLLREPADPSSTDYLASYGAESLALEKWFKAHRPEVIIGFGPEVPASLQRAGIVVPEDAAYVDLALEKTDGSLAGVQSNAERVGEMAVEILSSQLLQNVFGLPPLPAVTSVGGTWCPGRSLPRADARPDRLERDVPIRCA